MLIIMLMRFFTQGDISTEENEVEVSSSYTVMIPRENELSGS